MAGLFSPQKFHAQYGFLRDTHLEELRTLKTALKQAKKLLAHSPQALYAERDQEVQRLELAVKRAESMVNKDRQDKLKLEATSRAQKEEREKRKQGKAAWFLKPCLYSSLSAIALNR
jgi:ribosomal RNA-processing protein 36